MRLVLRLVDSLVGDLVSRMGVELEKTYHHIIIVKSFINEQKQEMSAKTLPLHVSH